MRGSDDPTATLAPLLDAYAAAVRRAERERERDAFAGVAVGSHEHRILASIGEALGLIGAESVYDAARRLRRERDEARAELASADAALDGTIRHQHAARALVRALVAAWDHDRGAHALRCGGALVEAVGRCREAMEEWG